MARKNTLPTDAEPKAIDRCAARLLALFEDQQHAPRLGRDEQRAAYDEIVAYLEQLGDDAWGEMLQRLYARAELLAHQHRPRSWWGRTFF